MSARRPAERERVPLAQRMKLLVGGNPLTVQIRTITRVVGDGRRVIRHPHTSMLPRGERRADADVACRVGAFAADGGDGAAERVRSARAALLRDARGRLTKEFAEMNEKMRRDWQRSSQGAPLS